MSNITEFHIQARLMRYAMGKNHEFVLPNNTSIFYWEADLISMTKSRYSHEYEIKLNIADYNADFNKRYKHQRLSECLRPQFLPNYFWYVTYGFDIEPPEYAGWITVDKDGRCNVIKQAPKLHNIKLSDKQIILALRGLAYRINNFYNRNIAREWDK